MLETLKNTVDQIDTTIFIAGINDTGKQVLVSYSIDTHKYVVMQETEPHRLSTTHYVDTKEELVQELLKIIKTTW